MHAPAGLAHDRHVDSVVSEFCVRCGQPVMLHLTDLDASGEPPTIQLQLWGCPWCHTQAEARLPGTVAFVSRRFPSAR